jgi:hypothetical protein
MQNRRVQNWCADGVIKAASDPERVDNSDNGIQQSPMFAFIA